MNGWEYTETKAASRRAIWIACAVVFVGSFWNGYNGMDWIGFVLLMMTYVTAYAAGRLNGKVDEYEQRSERERKEKVNRYWAATRRLKR